MPKLLLFESAPLNADAVDTIRQLLGNPGDKGSRELVEDLNQLCQNPKCTMPARLATVVCFDLGLMNSVHLQTMLLNSISAAGVRPIQSQSKFNMILLEMNDWVLKHAFAAGFLPPEPK